MTELVKMKNKIEYLVIALASILAGYLIAWQSVSVVLVLAFLALGIFSVARFESILILLSFYIPFQVALNIASGIDLASGRVAILTLFAVWFVRSLAQKNINISLSLQTIFLSAFLVLAAFSTLWAFEDDRAFRKILVFLSILPLYFMVSSIEKKNVYKILDALFIGAFIIAVIGLIEFALQFVLGIDPVMDFWAKIIAPLFYGNEFGAEVVSNPSWLVNVNGATLLRVFSLFPDPHMFSFYVGLVLPILFSFILFYDKSSEGGSFVIRHEFPLLVLFLAILISEILTFSRGGYIGLVAGMGSLILVSWKYFSGKKKFVIGTFFAAFLILVLATNPQFISRLLSSFDFNEGSNSERIKNWSQGYGMFSDNFLLGVGIGNYSYEIRPSADYRIPIYAHNTYLDIGAEMGIFALLSWILLFGVSIYQLFRAGTNALAGSDRALSFGLMASLIWFMTHSFFDTAIYSPTVLSILMVILAMTATISGKSIYKEIK